MHRAYLARMTRIIFPAVSDEQAKAKYPNGWKAPKPYLRIVAAEVGKKPVEKRRASAAFWSMERVFRRAFPKDS